MKLKLYRQSKWRVTRGDITPGSPKVSCISRVFEKADPVICRERAHKLLCSMVEIGEPNWSVLRQVRSRLCAYKFSCFLTSCPSVLRKAFDRRT